MSTPRQEAIISVGGENLVNATMAEIRAQFDVLNRRLQDGADDTRRRNEDAAQGIATAWKDVAIGWNQSLELLGKLRGGLQALGSAAKEGASSLAVSAQFGRRFEQAEQALERLRQASAQRIDDTSLQALANRLEDVGLGLDGIATVLDASRAASAAWGREYRDVLEQLTNAVATGREGTLRQYGVVIDVKTAYSDLARTLGVSVEELSKAERVSARLTATMAALGQEVQGAPLDRHAEALERVSTMWENLKSQLKEYAAEVVVFAVDANQSMWDQVEAIGKRQQQQVLQTIAYIKRLAPDSAVAKFADAMERHQAIIDQNQREVRYEAKKRDASSAWIRGDMDPADIDEYVAGLSRGRDGRGRSAGRRVREAYPGALRDAEAELRREAEMRALAERTDERASREMADVSDRMQRALARFDDGMAEFIGRAGDRQSQMIEETNERIEAGLREQLELWEKGLGDLGHRMADLGAMSAEGANLFSRSVGLMIESMQPGKSQKAAAGVTGIFGALTSAMSDWGGFQYLAELSRFFEYLGTPGLQWLAPLHLAATVPAMLLSKKKGGRGAAGGAAAGAAGSGGSGYGVGSTEARKQWQSASKVPDQIVINVRDSTVIDGQPATAETAGYRLFGMLARAGQALDLRFPGQGGA